MDKSKSKLFLKKANTKIGITTTNNRDNSSIDTGNQCFRNTFITFSLSSNLIILLSGK